MGTERGCRCGWVQASRLPYLLPPSRKCGERKIRHLPGPARKERAAGRHRAEVGILTTAGRGSGQEMPNREAVGDEAESKRLPYPPAPLPRGPAAQRQRPRFMACLRFSCLRCRHRPTLPLPLSPLGTRSPQAASVPGSGSPPTCPSTGEGTAASLQSCRALSGFLLLVSLPAVIPRAGIPPAPPQHQLHPFRMGCTAPATASVQTSHTARVCV